MVFWEVNQLYSIIRITSCFVVFFLTLWKKIFYADLNTILVFLKNLHTSNACQNCHVFSAKPLGYIALLGIFLIKWPNTKQHRSFYFYMICKNSCFLLQERKKQGEKSFYTFLLWWFCSWKKVSLNDEP